MGSQDDLAIFILINGLKNSQIVLKESKEYLLGLVRTSNLHEHKFFSKILYVLSDYAEWNGGDAVARDFGIPVAHLKRILPKNLKSRKKTKKDTPIQEDTLCMNKYSASIRGPKKWKYFANRNFSY